MKRLKNKPPLIASKALVYLFSKFYQDSHLQKLLIWRSIVEISQSDIIKVHTLEGYIQYYTETLVRNFIDKLKIIHILPDPSLPFNLLRSLTWFSNRLVFLKYSQNLLNHLNRFFDGFYLTEDVKAIKCVFPLYKIVIQAISESILNDEKQSVEVVKTSNILRRVILRVKPYILEKDAHFCHYALDILKIACFPLSSTYLFS